MVRSADAWNSLDLVEDEIIFESDLVVVFLQRLSHARQQHIQQMSLAAAGDIRMCIQHQLQPGGVGFYRAADKEQRFGVNRLGAFLQRR